MDAIPEFRKNNVQLSTGANLYVLDFIRAVARTIYGGQYVPNIAMPDIIPELTRDTFGSIFGFCDRSRQWQDLNQDQRALYYVRVLENPKCRWSTWDAIRAGVAPRENMHTTDQDRAWTSPIWYNP